jgi:hypothetical protein
MASTITTAQARNLVARLSRAANREDSDISVRLWVAEAAADMMLAVGGQAPAWLVPPQIEIKLKREPHYGGVQVERRLDSYTTPADIDWPSADGTSRPGPRAGQYVGYGSGLDGLRSLLRRKYPGAKLTETWKTP